MIPPEVEVKGGRYHYEECPLEVQPPMDHRTFLHCMVMHQHEDISRAPITVHKDATFLKRLPKKTGCSIFSETMSDLLFGWGVHILEGPNKVAICCIAFIGLSLSFLMSLTYAIAAQTQEQGFGIGQWMVAVLTTGLTALYFQWSET
jgi:hypothetical protein